MSTAMPEPTEGTPRDQEELDLQLVPTTVGGPPKTPVSPKVVAQAAASLLAGVLVAVLTALLTPQGQDYLGRLPDVVGFLLIAAFPTVISAVAGYAISSLKPATWATPAMCVMSSLPIPSRCQRSSTSSCASAHR